MIFKFVELLESQKIEFSGILSFSGNERVKSLKKYQSNRNQ